MRARGFFGSTMVLALGCADSCARDSPAVAPPPAAQATAAPVAAQPPEPAAPADGKAPLSASAASYLKGQTHVHTARSYDAKTPPERVLSFYSERGYDFVALTDHNRITVVEPPPGLLLIPGVELTQNSTICEPKPAPGYRCLFHTTALFVDPKRDAKAGARFFMPFVEGRQAAFLAQMRETERLGGIPVLNHPSFHFAADGRTIVALAKRGLRLVELFNAGLDQQHPEGRAAAERRAEALWDEVLSQGAEIYAVATDDAHHFDDASERARMGKYAYTGDRAWIMVRAEKDPVKIRAALLAGEFYATTGVLPERLSRSSREIQLELETPARITFVGRGGKVLEESRGTTARYTLRGDESYVRAVVEADSGAKAWLQPVFTTKSP